MARPLSTLVPPLVAHFVSGEESKRQRDEVQGSSVRRSLRKVSCQNWRWGREKTALDLVS